MKVIYGDTKRNHYESIYSGGICASSFPLTLYLSSTDLRWKQKHSVIYVIHRYLLHRIKGLLEVSEVFWGVRGIRDNNRCL